MPDVPREPEDKERERKKEETKERNVKEEKKRDEEDLSLCCIMLCCVVLCWSSCVCCLVFCCVELPFDVLWCVVSPFRFFLFRLFFSSQSSHAPRLVPVTARLSRERPRHLPTTSLMSRVSPALSFFPVSCHFSPCHAPGGTNEVGRNCEGGERQDDWWDTRIDFW